MKKSNFWNKELGELLLVPFTWDRGFLLVNITDNILIGQQYKLNQPILLLRMGGEAPSCPLKN